MLREDGGMEVSIVEQNLKQAREHIALGSRHIARQREIVAEIKERGGNSRRLSGSSLPSSTLKPCIWNTGTGLSAS